MNIDELVNAWSRQIANDVIDQSILTKKKTIGDENDYKATIDHTNRCEYVARDAWFDLGWAVERSTAVHCP